MIDPNIAQFAAPPAESRQKFKTRPPAPAAPIWCTTAALLLLLGSIAAHWRKVDSGELLFHLQAGEVIENTGQVPNRDIFSATASVEPWAYIEWLWARAVALAYQPLEWTGVTALAVALVAITAASAYLRNRNHGSRPLESFLVLTLTVVALVPAWQASPFMAVTPLFVLALLISESRQLWPLIILPLIVALWANLHVAFLLPLLAPIVRLVVPEKTRSTQSSQIIGKPRMLLFVVIVAGILCALLTPHSTNIFPEMFDRITAAAADFAAHPAQHFTDPAYLWQLAVAVAFAGIAVAGKAALARWQVAMMLLLAVMALTISPGAVTFLLLFTLAPGAAGLTALLTRTWQLHPVRHLAAAALLLSSLLMMPAVLLSSQLVGKFWGAGIRDGVFPETAGGRLSAIPLRGSVLNRSKDGGYLIWRLWPGWRVCADERPGLYNRHFREQYEMIWQGATGWRAMFSLWRVYAVLGDTETAQMYPEHNLYYELAASPEWVAAYWDNDSILYVKEGINLASTNLSPFRQFKPGISWSAMKARIQSREQWMELAADLRRALMDDPTNALAQEFLRLTEAEL